MLRLPPLAAAAAVLLGSCANQENAPPAFALDSCMRVTLIDAASGAAIVGAEDLDIDRKTGRIFISAYDRGKAESAARKRAPSVPQGGVYAVELSELRSSTLSLKVRPLIDSASIEGGLRPHGMSYDPSNGGLTFINRGYAREGRAWRMQPRLVSIEPAGATSISEVRVECSANDLASAGGIFLMTLDHGGCGLSIAIEDMLGTRGGRVVDDKGAPFVSGLGLANGLVAVTERDFVVAATRERAVHVLLVQDGRAEITSTIETGAAPDNLTLSDQGRVVAAVHPSLLAIGMQRKLGFGRSPSRIVEIDLQAGSWRLLFDDPKASLVSAATVAISAQDMLIIGSVIDPGLVVCRRGASNP